MNEKQWLKVYIISSIFCIMFLLVSIIILNEKGRPLRFSNSICYDAKLNYIHKNQELLAKAKTIVIGSSMGLNNIDSDLLDKTIFHDVINLSSWGLQIGEVYQLLKLINLSNIKYIIYPTQYIDFTSKKEKTINKIEVKKFLYHKFSLYPYFYTLSSFSRNLRNNINYSKLYLNKNNYTYLCFDKSGDVNYNFDNSSYIDKKLWSKPYLEQLNLQTFQTLIQLNNYIKSIGAKLIVVITPLRAEILKNTKTKDNYDIYCKKLKSLSSTNHYLYINTNSILNLKDIYFIDKSHLNNKGAEIISKTINTYMKKSKYE